MKKVMVVLSDDLHKEYKVWAAERGVSMCSLMFGVLKNWARIDFKDSGDRVAPEGQ